MQQDPYQQFASPYVALGGDPVNMVDPSGGWSLSGILEISKIGVAAVTTFLGAVAGGAATAGSGNAKGMIVGAFLGLASNFVGGGGIGGAAVQAVIGVTKEVVNEKVALVTVAPQPQVLSNTGVKVNETKVNETKVNGTKVSGARYSSYNGGLNFVEKAELWILNNEDQAWIFGHLAVALKTKSGFEYLSITGDAAKDGTAAFSNYKYNDKETVVDGDNLDKEYHMNDDNEAEAWLTKHYSRIFSIEITALKGKIVLFEMKKFAQAEPYSSTKRNCADAVIHGLEKADLYIDDSPWGTSFPNKTFFKLFNSFEENGFNPIIQPIIRR